MSVELGKHLRLQRQVRGWGLRDVERRSGVNSGYLSQLERGQVGDIRSSTLAKVAAAYDLPEQPLRDIAFRLEADVAGYRQGFEDGVAAARAAMRAALTKMEEAADG